MAPIPGGYPYEQKIPNATQVRLTTTGVQFLEDNIDEIAASSVPGGLAFPYAGTTITITINSLNLDPVAPNILRINPLNLTVTGDNIPFEYDTGFLGTVSCEADINTGPDINFYGDLVFDINPGSTRTHVSLANPTIEGFSIADDVSIGGDFLCEFADVLVPIIDAIFDLDGLVVDQLTGPIEDAMNALCQTCDETLPCPQLSTCGGECTEDTGGECVQGLGMEGRMNIGAGLAAYAQGLHANMDILSWLGGYAQAENGGMSLGMLGGGLPDGHDTCVPTRPAPAIVAVPESPVFEGNVFDLGPKGEVFPFDVGIGISKLFLDTLGWSAYDAGALCLDLGSNAPRLGEFLNSIILGFVGADISHLVHGNEGVLPLFLLLRPQQPPTFTIGDGTITYEDDGTPIIGDPLITVDMPEFAIDFYMLVDQRYVRLMRVLSDVKLPIALDVNDMGQVIPLMGAVDAAFTNISVEGSELLAADPADLADTFPVLFGLVGGFLGDALPPFDLPEMQGFVLEDPIFRGVEGAFVGIFTRLDFEPPAPAYLGVDTRASLVDVHTPVAEKLRIGQGGQPTIDVEVPTLSQRGQPVEWSYRLDGGLWSIYQRSARATLASAPLKLQGRHRLEVRAREIGAPRTLDPSPDLIEFIVDAVPPELTALDNGVSLDLAASDNVSPRDRIELGWAVADGEPTWGADKVVPWPPGSLPVTLYARDEAGNVRDVSVERREFHARVPAPPDEGGCSCEVARGVGPMPFWAFVALALALGLVLRRKGRCGP
ncbi:MAG: MYXO-CTERM sorting domain-containing protein [Myxococcota bacterium]